MPKPKTSTQGALETAVDFAYDLHEQRCDCQKQVAALTAALAGMVRLFNRSRYFDDDISFEVSAPETIAAVHILADVQIVEITKDCSPAWVRAMWKGAE